MKTLVKSAIAAVALTVIASASALAAEACCCKDKDGKMACCEKKGETAASAPAGAQQHQH